MAWNFLMYKLPDTHHIFSDDSCLARSGF